MIDKQIQNFVSEKSRNTEKWFKENCPDIHQYIIENTKFLPENSLFRERKLCISENIKPKSCEVCGNPTKLSYQHKKFRDFCSYKCSTKMVAQKSVNKIKQTKLEKYGDVNYNNIYKTKETKLKKYGIETFNNSEKSKITRVEKGTLCSSPDIIKKMKQTKLEKYGDPNYVNTEKARETKLEKYGDPNYCNVVKIAETKTARYGVAGYNNYEKIRSTFIDRYGDPREVLTKDMLIYEHYTNKLTLTEIGDKYNLSNVHVGNLLRENNIDTIRHPISSQEKKICSIFENHNIYYETNTRKILKRKEIDIFLPEYNLGIEVNGVYWHSQKDDKNYHYNKYIETNKQGIQLLQFWDYEIDKQFDIVKNMILSKIGKVNKIFARKCYVKEVSKKEKGEFLNKYHLQGNCGSSLDYGLCYDKELVSVMSLLNHEDEWELVRFCSNNQILGGASKLLKAFTDKGITNISSFSDNMKSNGNLYYKLGFRKEKDIRPDYRYFYKNKIYHKFSFRKERFREDENLLYEEGLSETELAVLNNIRRLYDAGKQKFVFTV